MVTRIKSEQVVANARRQAILDALDDGELTTRQIAEKTGLPINSHHMCGMVHAGLVNSRDSSEKFEGNIQRIYWRRDVQVKTQYKLPLLCAAMAKWKVNHEEADHGRR